MLKGLEVQNLDQIFLKVKYYVKQCKKLLVAPQKSVRVGLKTQLLRYH